MPSYISAEMTVKILLKLFLDLVQDETVLPWKIISDDEEE